ncbi:unnamed protein product [Protopolystoma xenopodis]|uniref:Uncharacterized protein n=1 Tax=Protopolystoma xenopodis TaxID=117903 RepID=A0A3S5CJT0_9PLAT|nr:unnamed protein product [Protopolystoma xenopodis]
MPTRPNLRIHGLSAAMATMVAILHVHEPASSASLSFVSTRHSGVSVCPPVCRLLFLPPFSLRCLDTSHAYTRLPSASHEPRCTRLWDSGKSVNGPRRAGLGCQAPWAREADLTSRRLDWLRPQLSNNSQTPSSHSHVARSESAHTAGWGVASELCPLKRPIYCSSQRTGARHVAIGTVSPNWGGGVWLFCRIVS